MKKNLKIGISILSGLVVVAIAVYLAFFAPADWQSARSSAATGIDENQNPWIGAQKPEIIIHEYLDYECPHCSIAHKKLRSMIARDMDKVRLVRHDYGRMRCKTQLGSNIIKKCQLVRAAICASKQVSFWEWNDAVIAAPRHDTKMNPVEYIDSLAKQFNLPKVEFDECINSDEVLNQAQKIYDETAKAGVNATPTYMVDGKKYNLLELLSLLQEKI